MDVKTTFLNGYLKKEIYLEHPEGFVMFGQEKKVCRLIFLYKLKQAPKQWHERFDTTVNAFEYCTTFLMCVFILNAHPTILLLLSLCR